MHNRTYIRRIYTKIQDEVLYKHRSSDAWFQIYCLLTIEENAQSVRSEFPYRHWRRQTFWDYFLPLYLTGAVYRDFVRNILPELLQDVDLQNRIHLWVIYDQVFHHTFFLQFGHSGNLEHCVSRTMDRTRWNNSIACWLPWFKSLILLSLGTPEACC